MHNSKVFEAMYSVTEADKFLHTPHIYNPLFFFFFLNSLYTPFYYMGALGQAPSLFLAFAARCLFARLYIASPSLNQLLPDEVGNTGWGAVTFHEARATKSNGCLPNAEVYDAEAVGPLRRSNLPSIEST
ncbi:hypothetical protein HDV64DRAFT_262387 [Trichoderma sp. TUCIM 5745]